MLRPSVLDAEEARVTADNDSGPEDDDADEHVRVRQEDDSQGGVGHGNDATDDEEKDEDAHDEGERKRGCLSSTRRASQQSGRRPMMPSLEGS